ncbi:MAG: sulfurtransferase [Thaumarchaeota archaeon]|nr:MAG: sulfurtransferase [Nitrososphaerota archaeon]
MQVLEKDYSHPETLVDTDWVSHHMSDSTVRVAEVDYDPVANYSNGHVPGAVLFDWKKDLNDPLTRDILSKAQLEELFGKNGVSNDTTLVLYGDFNNWFAAYAFWDLKYYGVEKVKLMNGGRKKWLLEDKPVKEFTGEILAPPEYPTEHAQRGGHIPGAVNIPWAQAVNDADGTFKKRQDLEQLYRAKGIVPEKEIITYCRIGERSSHTWFALKYLLGYPNVRNYDGSWTEWGNSVKFPIEK